MPQGDHGRAAVASGGLVIVDELDGARAMLRGIAVQLTSRYA